MLFRVLAFFVVAGLGSSVLGFFWGAGRETNSSRYLAGREALKRYFLRGPDFWEVLILFWPRKHACVYAERGRAEAPRHGHLHLCFQPRRPPARGAAPAIPRHPPGWVLQLTEKLLPLRLATSQRRLTLTSAEHQRSRVAFSLRGPGRSSGAAGSRRAAAAPPGGALRGEMRPAPWDITAHLPLRALGAPARTPVITNSWVRKLNRRSVPSATGWRNTWIWAALWYVISEFSK